VRSRVRISGRHEDRAGLGPTHARLLQRHLVAGYPSSCPVAAAIPTIRAFTSAGSLAQDATTCAKSGGRTAPSPYMLGTFSGRSDVSSQCVGIAGFCSWGPEPESANALECLELARFCSACVAQVFGGLEVRSWVRLPPPPPFFRTATSCFYGGCAFRFGADGLAVHAGHILRFDDHVGGPPDRRHQLLAPPCVHGQVRATCRGRVCASCVAAR
jgi:hypothetical protein